MDVAIKAINLRAELQGDRHKKMWTVTSNTNLVTERTHRAFTSKWIDKRLMDLIFHQTDLHSW